MLPVHKNIESNTDPIKERCFNLLYWFCYLVVGLWILGQTESHPQELVNTHQLLFSYDSLIPQLIKSSSLPVLIIFCSIYNPAALPLATSAFTAADQAPLSKLPV